jgi:hypothetical protein
VERDGEDIFEFDDRVITFNIFCSFYSRSGLYILLPLFAALLS